MSAMKELAIEVMDTVTWATMRCPAGIRTACQICPKLIGAGMRIAYVPNMAGAIRHERCHTAYCNRAAA